MAAFAVRNLPDEIYRALRLRAAMNGRSTEAEVRLILEAAVMPDKRVRMGEALGRVGRLARLEDEDLDLARDSGPVAPVAFE